MSTLLDVSDLSVNFGGFVALDHANFSIDEGSWLMVVGPNGAGKSTVIRAVSQCVEYTGRVLFEGIDVKGCKPAHLARSMGVLSQNHSVGYSFTVEEVVRLGRYSYSPGIFSQRTNANEESIELALELTGMKTLRSHSVLTLSGGELQRTFLAQLLAQDPKVLLLDEPTNHLDLVYQKQIFTLISEWLEETGRAVVSVVHDLSLARAYGTEAMLLDHGRSVAVGPVGRVFETETINAVYGMDVAAWLRTMLSQWD